MSTSALFLLTMLSAAPGAEGASPTAVDGHAPKLILVQDADAAAAEAAEEIGFMDKYFPLALKDDLDPVTEDFVLPFWLSQIFLPFGFLWAPYVFSDVDPSNDWVLDALLIVAAHAAVSICFVPCMFLPIPFVLAPCVFGFAAVNGLYLMPVALVNEYDRNIKRPEVMAKRKAKKDGKDGEGDDDASGDDDERKNQRKKRKRMPEREPASLPPGQPSYAMAF